MERESRNDSDMDQGGERTLFCPPESVPVLCRQAPHNRLQTGGRTAPTGDGRRKNPTTPPNRYMRKAPACAGRSDQTRPPHRPASIFRQRTRRPIIIRFLKGQG